MSRPGKPGIISTETQEYGDTQEPGTSDNVLVHQAFMDTFIDMSPTPEELVEQRDLQFAIQRAVQTLPYKYRSVVLLYYREHMNYAEIGQVLKVPVSTVKARFHRAKPFLRAALTAL